jgi:hypothetical protein
MKATATGPRWLLLLHQLPRKNEYFRVKIWRRLQRLGAVAIKGAVYALPRSEERNEDLQWVMREIVAAGGEATLVEANLIQGLNDVEVEAMFGRARDEDWRSLADDVRQTGKLIPKRGKVTDEIRRRVEAEMEKFRRRFDEIATIDFFPASGREIVTGLLDELVKRLTTTKPAEKGPKVETYRARTWVTRKGIHVDRMASAWLIRRFIDPAAKLKWVSPKGYIPEAGELRFDMFEAEFTHVGESCTFEVLIARTGQKERALQKIAEIVHDIDIKDERFQHAETAGVASLVAAIALTSADDDERLTRGGKLFDDLYELFSRKRGA